MSVSKKIPVLALVLLLAAARLAEAQITHLGGTQMSGWVGRNNLAFDPINRVFLSIVYRAPVVGRFLDENGAQIGSDFVIATEPGYTAWASIAFGGPPNDPVFLVTYLKVMDSVNHSKFARFVRYMPGAPSVGGPILVTPVLDEWGFSEKAQNVWNGSRFVVGTRIRYVGVPIPTFQVNTLDLNGNVSAPMDLGDGQDYYGSPSVACSTGDSNVNTCMAVGFKAGYATGYSGGSYGRLFNMTTLTPITGLFHLQATGANEDQQVVFQRHNGRFLAEWLWGSPTGALIQTRLINLDGSMSVLDPTRAFAGPGAGSNTISYNETTRTTLIATKAGNAAQLFAFELGDDGYPVNPNNAILITNWDGTVQDYTPSIAANNGRGEWLLAAVLTNSTLVHRIQGTTAPTTGQPLSILSNPALPGASQNIAYSTSLFAFGGAVPYTWSLVSGALPPGLGVNGLAISGTPTVAGSYNFRLRVTSADSNFAEKDFSMQVTSVVVVPPGPAGAQITHLGGTQMSGWVGRNNLAFDPINKVFLSIVYRAPVVGRFLDENGAQVGSDFVIATEPGYTAWASIAFGGPPNDPVFLVTYLKVMDSVNHSKFARFVRYVPGAPSVSGPILVTPVLDEWGFSEKAQNVWNGSRFVVGTRIRYVGVPIPTFQVNTLDLNGNVSAPVDLGDGQDYYGSPSIACSAGNSNINTCMAVGFKAGYATGYSGGSYGRLFNMTTLTPITGLFHLQATGANEDQQVVFQKHNGRFLTEWLWGSPTGAVIQTRLVNADGSMSILDPTRAFAGPGAGSNTISYNEATRTTLIATKAGNAAQLFAFELGDDGYPLNLNNAILIANWDGTVQDYTPSIAANNGRGEWLLSGVLTSSTLVHRIQGVRNGGAVQPGGQTVMPIGFPMMRLNGDAGGDVLASKTTTGLWARLLGQGGGGFAESNGNWGQGFQPLAMEFNGDALADVFLSNSTTGEWVKMLNTGFGFAPIGSGAWWPGWQKHVLDLNGDGLSDLFLYDPASGVWYKAISTSNGFVYEQSQWSPDWEITPMNLNGDAFGDMFLFNRSTGRWFWVLGQNGGFSYPSSGFWAPVWDRYPGDFNGDGLDDLLLHDPSTGQVYVSFNVGGSFYFISKIWQLGWKPHVADLDGDGADDLLLHHPSTGQWFKSISNKQGAFTDVGWGTWMLGWQIYPTDFNGDGRKDFLVYNPQTGAWFQCLNLVNNTFTYIGGQWNPDLTIVVGATVR